MRGSARRSGDGRWQIQKARTYAVPSAQKIADARCGSTARDWHQMSTAHILYVICQSNMRPSLAEFMWHLRLGSTQQSAEGEADYTKKDRYRIGATCDSRRLSRRASTLAAGARKKTDPGRPVQLLAWAASEL